MTTKELGAMEKSAKRADTVQDGFRAAMSQLAAGVVMVTCHLDGKPWGLTVSACCSVSMEPPLLLVSLGRQTASAHAIGESGSFGVSVLGESVIEVARFGSSRGQPKFLDHFCHGDIVCESPAVGGALAHVDCTVEQTVAAGDHTIYIGRVRDVILEDGDRPLVYHAQSYHRLGEATDLHVGPVVDETVDSLLYDYPIPREFSRVRSLGA
ncbi:MAG: Flavoprotein oxygenase family protein [Conexibacter sp.]|jgi:flavin reductase ActVB|nr:Flavoprotein oxygenase family protein [Conexibacter sp.]